MKIIKLYFISTLILVTVFSCKKEDNSIQDDSSPEEITVSYSDSISFTINGKQYIFQDRYSVGAGNYKVNIKPSPTLIDGGKLAYNTGGYYWYGEKDSTLYSVFYSLRPKLHSGSFTVSFTKKYEDNQLKRGSLLLTPQNHFDIFKLGKQTFAVDLEKENTMDGISIDIYGIEPSTGKLGTSIPGFSILVRSDLTKDIQDNSDFEITKVEKLDNDFYLIEAKFEVNLFDDKADLYRLKKGFLRIKTKMAVSGEIWGIY